MNFIKPVLFFVSIAFAAASCSENPDNQEKQPWTEKEKKEFKDNCFTSTRFSFEQMGKHLDSAKIVTICDCTAQDIESKYSYGAASRIPKAEVQSILKAALEKCAPDVMSTPSTDSLAPAR